MFSKNVVNVKLNLKKHIHKQTNLTEIMFPVESPGTICDEIFKFIWKVIVLITVNNSK